MCPYGHEKGFGEQEQRPDNGKPGVDHSLAFAGVALFTRRWHCFTKSATVPNDEVGVEDAVRVTGREAVEDMEALGNCLWRWTFSGCEPGG